jgi:hypothetical protein
VEELTPEGLAAAMEQDEQHDVLVQFYGARRASAYAVLTCNVLTLFFVWNTTLQLRALPGV